MLRKIEIDNYKSLVGFSIELESEVLLVGANGSGKTSMLEALMAVQDVVVHGVDVGKAFPPSSRTRWQPEVSAQRIQLTFDVDGVEYIYQLHVEHDDSNGAEYRTWIEFEAVSVNGPPYYNMKRGRVLLFGDKKPSTGPIHEFPADRRRSFLPVLEVGGDTERVRLCRELIQGLWLLQPNPFSIVSGPSNEVGWLERHCSNFEAWFRPHFGKNVRRMGKLIDDLSGPLPGLENVRYDATDERLRFTFRYKDKEHDMFLRELSQGQIQLVILYALARLELSKGRTFLLDEPDNFLAPREIQPLLMYLSDIAHETNAQVIVTSHHPYVADYLASRQCLVFERSNGAATTVRAMTLSEDELEGGMKASEWILEQGIFDGE